MALMRNPIMEPIVLDSLFPQKRTLESGFHPSSLVTDSEADELLSAAKPDVSQVVLEQDPNKILNQRILESLNRVLASSGSAAIETLDPQDFTPEKVAGNILNSISGFLAAFAAQNPDQEKLDGFFSQIREGFERGFSEAKEILQGFGALEQVEQDIQKTYELVQDGIDGLEKQVNNNPVSTPAINELEQTYSASFSKSQSGSITIKTQEGDLVTVDFSKSASSSVSTYVSVANQSVEKGFEQQVSASANLSFSVQGNLNQDEQKAVEKLMHRIDKIADKFFEGKFEQAFRKAANIKFDGEQLSSFSVDLNTEISRSVQATRTESTSAPIVEPAPLGQDESEDGSTQITVPKADTAEDLIKTLEEISDNEEGAQLLKSPRETIRDLFKGIAEYKLEKDPVLKSLESSSEKLLKDLVTGIQDVLRSLPGLNS
jgi:hypothetical protein